MGITVAAISMMTIPATVGVITRRSQVSRKASPNWNREETRTRTASSAGPPSRSAATEIAMKAPEVPMSRTCPAPNRPTRFACRMVERPHTVSAAKTAQERYGSPSPAARITMAGVRTIPAICRIAICRPSPKASASGGLSSGW